MWVATTPASICSYPVSEIFRCSEELERVKGIETSCSLPKAVL